MRKRKNTPARRVTGSDCVDPTERAEAFGARLRQMACAGSRASAGKALADALFHGLPFHASAGFASLGKAAWSWPGFARESLRALEQCASPAGGQCLSLWIRHATDAGALSEALGRWGHARGQALAALGSAPFWSHESCEVAAVELGSLLSFCVERSRDSEASACLKSSLSSWLLPDGKNAKSQAALRLAAERAALELSRRDLWIGPAGEGRQSAAFSLLERLSFQRAAPVLLMALGERGVVELQSRADLSNLAHYAVSSLDEAAWRFALRHPRLFRLRDANGQRPGDILAQWLNRVCEPGLARRGANFERVERMLGDALRLEGDLIGAGFGSEFLAQLTPSARALRDQAALSGALLADLRDPIRDPREQRARSL